MKFLFILVLAALVFGSGTYAVWRLYVKPQQELQLEKARGPAPAPPDPTLPEYEKRVAAQDSQSLLEARASWAEFIERFPESGKIEAAKEVLGKLNAAIFLSPLPSPEKQTYVVRPGDVITRVAVKYKTTPELLMRSNNLSGSMLRIGQRLLIAPNDFSVLINRRQQRVTLLNGGKFFKQYVILTMPGGPPRAATPAGKHAAATPRPPKVLGKVTDRIGWFNGNRVSFSDKEFAQADYWIMITPGGHNLYSERPAPPGAVVPKPQGGGYVLAPEDIREIAPLLKKNDPVTID